MHYLAFSHRDGCHYKVYAVKSVSGAVGEPPYCRVRIQGDELFYEQLIRGGNEYNKVEKWVGINRRTSLPTTPQRRIMNDPKASCHVTERDVISLLLN